MSEIIASLITCRREHFLIESFKSIPKNIDLIVVNDGPALAAETLNLLKEYREDFKLHQNVINRGVGESKNIGFKYALEQGAEHIFMIEDDIIVKDETIFNRYIEARNKTGVQEFLYGYHGPANKGGISKGKPQPRFIVDYGNGIQIAINQHSVGAFCYFSREVLETVGLIDTRFKNAFDHPEMDYRIAKAGYAPGYWNFPDLANSYDYLDELACSEESSSIRGRPDWQENIQKGALLFKQKHGYLPAWQGCVPDTSETDVKKILKEIYKKYARV